MAAGRGASPWKREGKSGSDPVSPGSYGGWYKFRSPPSKYPTTSQQHKIGAAGRKTGATCKGKSGAEFRKCRHEIMAEVFGLAK